MNNNDINNDPFYVENEYSIFDGRISNHILVYNLQDFSINVTYTEYLYDNMIDRLVITININVCEKYVTLLELIGNYTGRTFETNRISIYNNIPLSVTK